MHKSANLQGNVLQPQGRLIQLQIVARENDTILKLYKLVVNLGHSWNTGLESRYGIYSLPGKGYGNTEESAKNSYNNEVRLQGFEL